MSRGARAPVIRSVLITQDTTRGASTKKVKKGTIVNVVATRLDDDGLKLLVRIGVGGNFFQVNADVTSWFSSVAEVRDALKL